MTLNTEAEERPTIGNDLDLWIFVAIMVSVSLVLLFVLFVVLRKVFKTNKVEGIVSISASNLNAQKIVHEDDIGGWDKSGFDYFFSKFVIKL